VFVSANLCIPTFGKPPYPGVLFHMGHYYSGKVSASYQKCCQGLAQLGYLVFALDPMGQGERIAYPDASGTNTRLGSAINEHDVSGKQLLCWATPPRATRSLGCDPQLRLPGCARVGRSFPACFHGPVPRRNSNHAAGLPRRSPARGRGLLGQHRKLRVRQLRQTMRNRIFIGSVRPASIAGICFIPWLPSLCWSK
jgi:hypothetical protein